MTADWRLFLKVTLPLAALNLINQASRTVMAIIGSRWAASRPRSTCWDPRGYSAALVLTIEIQVVVAFRLLGGKR